MVLNITKDVYKVTTVEYGECMTTTGQETDTIRLHKTSFGTAKASETVRQLSEGQCICEHYATRLLSEPIFPEGTILTEDIPQ